MKLQTIVACVCSSFVFALGLQSTAAEEKPVTTLITNAKIFNGVDEELITGKSILIEDNKIAKIAANITAPEGGSVIDAGGRILTPGFIDTHAHMMFQMSFGQAATADEEYIAYVATQTAETYLMMGFTTVRDVGGDSFSLKKAIDQGILKGPRIFPSGPMISQTSGHSDHRTDAQDARPLFNEPSVYMKYGHVAVADGVPEVLTVVREALRRGATQIKICTGGGTGSYADPLDVEQFTDEEIQAAVQAATHWNTYVTSHCYNAEGIIRAVENGVKCIEHGNLMNEKAMRVMKEKNIWLSPQVIVYTFHPDGYTDDQKAKHDEAYAGIDTMFKVAKKIGFNNISFGSDIITSPKMLKRVPEEFELRTKWFTPAEILMQATSKSGELLMMAGPRNRYGKLGVIEEGALADLLLINGDPFKNISILTKPDESLALIMKDGKVYKDTLNE
ncbi:Imidazolonepropionase [Rubritalea squalenifaciens DSM 18772]|uniref:Imidazolonepropionase n=1 Tax=Rubritalea squalenifaciens DSM 18772 TaxID=1123071 RepID=A0A1M6M764_9BACT|nr:amidohydrolase family protein [Rubritalea squalenifaciens]SHJ79278.1 Imidazolonepropionase [Rubritalea squalenifaciens DSM 18772]